MPPMSPEPNSSIIAYHFLMFFRYMIPGMASAMTLKAEHGVPKMLPSSTMQKIA